MSLEIALTIRSFYMETTNIALNFVRFFTKIVVRHAMPIIITNL